MRTYRSRLIGICAVATAALLLSSCNSSGLGSDNSSGSTNESATGVWSGTDSVSGFTVSAIINSAGQATFIRSDGIQFVGSAQVSGSTLAVTVDGYSDFPNSFSDGSTYGIGTLNGAVTSGSSITATLSFTTNGGTAISGSWSLSYLAQSNNASSPATISGNYTDINTGAVLSITSNGVMTSQGPDSCVLNGSVSTGDSSHAIYEVSYTYESCTSTYAGLNGVQFTGLATLDSSVSPVQLVIAVTGASATNKYSIVSTLNGS
jgi:predicted small secreted protein